jgi:hypothetical protein
VPDRLKGPALGVALTGVVIYFLKR